MQLASRFSHRSPVLRSNHPLSDDQIRAVAPSIFADTPHESRSERYSYIPTATVLTELRKEGFQPFMVCQTRVRNEDRRDYTKHMLRRCATGGGQQPQLVAQQCQAPEQRADHRLVRSDGTAPTLMTSNSRTARCGPACRVVWEGFGQR